jgi:hypothetical protein
MTALFRNSQRLIARHGLAAAGLLAFCRSLTWFGFS